MTFWMFLVYALESKIRNEHLVPKLEMRDCFQIRNERLDPKLQMYK